MSVYIKTNVLFCRNCKLFFRVYKILNMSQSNVKYIKDCHSSSMPDPEMMHENQMHYICMAEQLKGQTFSCSSDNFLRAHETCQKNMSTQFHTKNKKY